MLFQCKKCGKICDVKLSKYFEVLLRRNWIFMCETCEKIDDWKKRSQFLNTENYFYSTECSIEGFDPRLSIWVENKIIREQAYCVIMLRDKTEYTCFPVELKEDYSLICRNDEYNPEIEYGLHRKGALEVNIPLSDIRSIKIMDIYRDVAVPDVEKPVYGYKGVCLQNGILEAMDYIYEIGILYEEPQQNPYQTDYQDVYSHFCLKMEDVLLKYGRDFISSPITLARGKLCNDMRLFIVKAEGHCFENTPDGWVSNRLALIKEVQKEEIIAYFNKRPELKVQVQKYFAKESIYDNIWEAYEKVEIKPYKQLLSDDEIEMLIIESCDYKKMGHCIQDDLSPKIERCQRCKCFNFPMSVSGELKTYHYLKVRNAIRQNTFNDANTSYQYLLEQNDKNYLDAIQRLIKYNQPKNGKQMNSSKLLPDGCGFLSNSF